MKYDAYVDAHEMALLNTWGVTAVPGRRGSTATVGCAVGHGSPMASAPGCTVVGQRFPTIFAGSRALRSGFSVGSRNNGQGHNVVTSSARSFASSTSSSTATSFALLLLLDIFHDGVFNIRKFPFVLLCLS